MCRTVEDAIEWLSLAVFYYLVRQAHYSALALAQSGENKVGTTNAPSTTWSTMVLG